MDEESCITPMRSHKAKLLSDLPKAAALSAKHPLRVRYRPTRVHPRTLSAAIHRVVPSGFGETGAKAG